MTGSPGLIRQERDIAILRRLGTAFVTGQGWIGSLVPALKSLNFKSLLLLGGLLAPGVATAQDAGKPWPEAIKHRNARYAVRERVQDEAGDAREAVLRDLVLARSQDRLGDVEETRRAKALREVPPKAIAYAATDRAVDPRGDAEQAFVAKLPSKERRHAELRRFRDFAGDQQELALFRINLIRFGPLRGEGVWQADRDRDREAEHFFNQRGEETRRDDKGEAASDQDVERRADRAADRQDERDYWRDDHEHDRIVDRTEDKVDQDIDREAEKAADELEKDAERDLERKLDKGDLDSDRDTERQIQREDEDNDLDD